MGETVLVNVGVVVGVAEGVVEGVAEETGVGVSVGVGVGLPPPPPLGGRQSVRTLKSTVAQVLVLLQLKLIQPMFSPQA